MTWPPDPGSVTPWQGKLEPSATKGSLGAEPGIGLGELMNMCALAPEMTAAATTTFFGDSIVKEIETGLSLKTQDQLSESRIVDSFAPGQAGAMELRVGE